MGLGPGYKQMGLGPVIRTKNDQDLDQSSGPKITETGTGTGSGSGPKTFSGQGFSMTFFMGFAHSHVSSQKTVSISLRQ